MDKEPTIKQAGSKLEREQEISWPEITLPTKFLSLQEPEVIKNLNTKESANLIRGANDVIKQWEALLEHDFKNYFASRHERSFLNIATYIQQLNKDGICPTILEVGCGPSFLAHSRCWPFSTENTPCGMVPICARLLGMFKERAMLDIKQISIVDPCLLEPYEEKFGLIPYGVAINLERSGGLGDVTFLDEKHRVIELPTTTFSLQGFRRCIVDKDLQHIFKETRTLKEFIGIIEQNVKIGKIQFLDSYDYKEAGEQDTVAVKEIVNNGPYDIVFGQNLNFPLGWSLPLVRNGGIFWSDPDSVNVRARQVTYL